MLRPQLELPPAQRRKLLLLLNMIKLLGLPPLASEHGADVDQLILYVHWLMAALFAGWLAYFFYVIIRFRKSNHPKADYGGVKSHATSYLEGAVALVEAVSFFISCFTAIIGILVSCSDFFADAFTFLSFQSAHSS